MNNKTLLAELTALGMEFSPATIKLHTKEEREKRFNLKSITYAIKGLEKFRSSGGKRPARKSN